MTTIRRIPTSKIDGDNANNTSTSEIRPYGEIAVYVGDNNKLELLMFDGIRTHLRSKVLNKGTFYGGDADGGEGNGADTIKLVPDEQLRRNGSDQYLIIDPTGGEPGHIHIRAGGNIDNSYADLFLGGEKNNVRVSDTYDHVQITTDFDGTNTRTWTFNNNGGLQLPGSSNGLIGESEPGVVVFSDLGFAVVTNANTEDSRSWIFNDQGALRFPGSTTIQDTRSIQANGTIINVPLNAAGDTVDYVGGASVLEIPKNSGTDQVQTGWIIIFENGGAQRTVTGVFDGGMYWSVQYDGANPGLGSSTYPLTIQSANYVLASNGNVTISLDNLAGSVKSYEFGADGTLTLPVGGDILDSDGNSVLGGGNANTGNITFNNDILKNTTSLGGEVSIQTASQQGDPNKAWTFSHNGAGSLHIPTGSSIKAEQGLSILATMPEFINFTNVRDFDTNSYFDFDQISIVNPGAGILNLIDPTSPNYAGGVGTIIRFVYRNYLVKEATLIEGFASNGNDPLTGLPQYTCRIDFNSTTMADLVKEISFEYSANWRFAPDGKLQLPLGGDVVDSTGVSQIANRAKGSWTVPDDTTATYSFTVPLNGTYSMWVNCNIPNGIITWNATVSVTNGNVPAIGQQYAWNYTGGGSPLLLTAIPNQIVGTAGSISTDDSYVGTTSNRFDFTIANTSGADQTVYWGYTKI